MPEVNDSHDSQHADTHELTNYLAPVMNKGTFESEIDPAVAAPVVCTPPKFQKSLKRDRGPAPGPNAAVISPEPLQAQRKEQPPLKRSKPMTWDVTDSSEVVGQSFHGHPVATVIVIDNLD